MKKFLDDPDRHWVALLETFIRIQRNGRGASIRMASELAAVAKEFNLLSEKLKNALPNVSGVVHDIFQQREA